MKKVKVYTWTFQTTTRSVNYLPPLSFEDFPKNIRLSELIHLSEKLGYRLNIGLQPKKQKGKPK